VSPAVLIMAKAPRPGSVKTRLHPLLSPDGCAALQAELIRQAGVVSAGLRDVAVPPADDRCGRADGAGAAARFREVTVFAAVDPPDAAAELAGLVPDATRLIGQRGAGLGERLAAATGDVLGDGYGPVVVIGADVPTLTPGRLAAAFGALAAGYDVVFGPALDGGYYLAGLTRPRPGIFALGPALWGGEQVLAASLAAARRLGLHARLLPALRDLDTPADAVALLADPLLPGRVAEVLSRPAASAHRSGTATAALGRVI
jgi:hypothetical protein